MMLLKAGWANAEITPPPGYPMAGYVRRTSVARGVLDPLFVRALVLGSGSEYFVVVLADILLLSNRWAGKLRQSIAGALNIGKSQVVVAATHTHSGPLIDTAPFDFSPAGSRSPASSYLRRVEGQMLRAVKQAAVALSPVVASFARIRVRGVASDRDRPQHFRSQPLFLFRFVNPVSTALLGIYGCHSTVLGYSNVRFSGDLLGGLAQRLEKRAEFVTFGCGAAANISTRFTRKAQTPQELSRLSGLAAEQVKQARFRALDVGSLRAREEKVFMSFRDLGDTPPAKAKGRGRLAEAGEEAQENLERIRQAAEFRRKGANIVLTRIRLGEVSLLALPFEIGLSTGDFFWRQARAIPLCYANGYWGYLPPASAKPSDYEAVSSAFPREADQRLRREVLAFLRRA
jgi:Neutral/alkaline non-lysosomal ceramidase, N-terminal